MSRLNALIITAGLAIFTVGCGGGMEAPSEEQKAEFNAKMDADMAEMTGKVSEKTPKK